MSSELITYKLLLRIDAFFAFGIEYGSVKNCLFEELYLTNENTFLYEPPVVLIILKLLAVSQLTEVLFILPASIVFVPLLSNNAELLSYLKLDTGSPQCKDLEI